MMRSLLTALALIVFLPSAWAGTPAPGFSDTLYVGGLSFPTAIAFLPDGRLLITEKGGLSGAQNAALKLFNGITTTTLGTIPVCDDGGMGLLGVAVDPSFTTNGFIYLYRTESNGGCASASGRSNEVVRVTMSGSTIGSLTVLLTAIRTDTSDHDGGGLRYNAADGKLYVSVGDTALGDNVGCPGDSTNPYAQDLNALEGKVLRLNLDGSVPSDNPFFGQAGRRGEIWAYGFRNPFRFGFDPLTGRLWLGDVGDWAWEEIDIVARGGGYGWPQCEGTQPPGCELPGDVPPILTYPHQGAQPGCPALPPGSLGLSVTGGAFAGNGFGAFAGDYLFGDFILNTVYRAVPTAARDGIAGTPTTIATNAAGPVDFIFGPDKALYYVSFITGQVRRVAAVASPTDEHLAGTRLVLKADAVNAAKKTLSLLVRDLALTLGGGDGSADDPTTHGGAVRVRGAGFDLTYLLPPGLNWSYIGQPGANLGYRYKDKNLANGPIKSAVLRPGRFGKIIGSGVELAYTLGSNPSPVDVVVRTGAKHRCMRFGGAVQFTPGKLTAKNALPPAACP